jgi:hypothetical protein
VGFVAQIANTMIFIIFIFIKILGKTLKISILKNIYATKPTPIEK